MPSPCSSDFSVRVIRQLDTFCARISGSDGGFMKIGKEVFRAIGKHACRLANLAVCGHRVLMSTMMTIGAIEDFTSNFHLLPYDLLLLPLNLVMLVQH